MTRLNEDVLEFLREQAIHLLNTAEDDQLVTRAREALSLLGAREILARKKSPSDPLSLTEDKVKATTSGKAAAPIQQFKNTTVTAKLSDKPVVVVKSEPAVEKKTQKPDPEEIAAKSSTDKAINKVLKKLSQPFKRHDIYKALRWNGVHDISEAAVSGWVNRAAKRGYLRPAETAGEYYTKDFTPVRIVDMPDQKTSPPKRETKQKDPGKAVQGSQIGDLDIVSGGGSLIKD